MPTVNANDRLEPSKILASVLFVAGIALLGYGTYTHFSIAGVARCDACAPWHPLFVLAPLGLGALLVVGAAYVFFSK